MRSLIILSEATRSTNTTKIISMHLHKNWKQKGISSVTKKKEDLQQKKETKKSSSNALAEEESSIIIKATNVSYTAIVRVTDTLITKLQKNWFQNHSDIRKKQ